jgi:transposase-like protein
MTTKRRISRYKISKIVECFVIDLTATQTSYFTGLNRNTINLWYNRFRTKIYKYQQEQFEKKLKGTVEIDESYFGSRRVRGRHGLLKRGRATHKQPVFGIYERKGRVYTEIVPDATKRTLIGIIRGRIGLESIIHSDSWRAYDGLVDVGYEKHFRVNHSKEYVNNKCHINGIESFWSFTKRRLQKFNGVKVNFELHLKECEWRHKKDLLQMKKELNELLKRS